MDSDVLSRIFLKVTEAAAIASAQTMGQGDRKKSDQVAVTAMRDALNKEPILGRVVIGEGERDKAPMLYVGEEVGGGDEGAPEIDIAVDPLEGTNLCANGMPNAIAVIAASSKGGLFYAPDVYLDKLIVGPSAKGHVDINAPVKHNLIQIAKALNYSVTDLVITVLDRERHYPLMSEIRKTGARIKLIGDGDVIASIEAAIRGTGVHAVMGAGGAPEGVLTAAAMKCLGGEIQAKFCVYTAEHKNRLEELGITDLDKVYTTDDLAPGDDIVMAATGVTSGWLLKGVNFFGDACRTHSIVMSYNPREIRFVDTIHIGKEFTGAVKL